MSAETKLGDEAKAAEAADISAREPISPAEARRRQRALSQQLRRMFDDVVKEPIPDDFRDLLEKIDSQASGDVKE